MSEWWTYRLSDFLLFSPQTYYRLFELYNQAVWPLQILTLALGGAVVVLIARRPARQGRLVAAPLAAAWLWVAWAYHLQRYAAINWAATAFAAGFALQAVLLLWTGVVRGRLSFRATGWPGRLGLAVFLYALLLHPLLAPLLGRPWAHAEVFGIAPDPTVIATLGVLLAADRSFWMLLLIPLLWCAISGAILWTMGSPDAFVPPLVALLAVALAGWKWFGLRRNQPAP